MILVLLGTQNNSFHRLLEKLDELINDKIIKEEVIVQSGYTKYETKNMKIFDMISQEELEKLQDKARVIITHGGVGSIISSIRKKKKVIAIPRLAEYQEHVNNHQKEIVELFNKKHYVIGIEGVEQLKQAILDIEKFIPEQYVSDNQKMLKTIEDFIEKV